MNENFIKALELKNNVVIIDELKDKLLHLENVNISEIQNYPIQKNHMNVLQSFYGNFTKICYYGET